MNGWLRLRILLPITFIFALVSASAFAQDTSTTQTSPSGQATVKTETKSGEVLYVSGNELLVKTDDGQVKRFVVPDNATATVEGKELTVHDLKPGMRLTRTITTTTTPTVVKTVRTIQGKVFHVNPPSSVILTLPDNTNKQYNIPPGQVFNINGREVDAFHLKKGMNVAATVITEEPQDVSTSSRTVTGEAAPPPTPPPQVPATTSRSVLLIVVPTTAPVQEKPAESAKANLPQTASANPLLALIGLLSLAMAVGLYMVRSPRRVRG
ncbi:MAG TPA: LPXTG cell wall anchor domain-containing protein [Candidatus Angelobacter sp.]